MKLQVYEINLKIYLLTNIDYKDVYMKISHFIDSSLAKNSNLLNLHNTNVFKNYTFNTFYPIENNQIYKKENIYNIQIRTINKEIAEYFYLNLQNHYTDDMKGLIANIKILQRKPISNIYSITPVIIKNDEFGYWKDNLSLISYERRLKENLIKKYNNATNSKIDENFDLFSAIELINNKPIGFSYKGKKLLGDKIKLHINDNISAQELAYLSLGTGIGEMNARGAGYVNYKWV